MKVCPQDLHCQQQLLFLIDVYVFPFKDPDRLLLQRLTVQPLRHGPPVSRAYVIQLRFCRLVFHHCSTDTTQPQDHCSRAVKAKQIICHINMWRHITVAAADHFGLLRTMGQGNIWTRLCCQGFDGNKLACEDSPT